MRKASRCAGLLEMVSREAAPESDDFILARESAITIMPDSYYTTSRMQPALDFLEQVAMAMVPQPRAAVQLELRKTTQYSG